MTYRSLPYENRAEDGTVHLEKAERKATLRDKMIIILHLQKRMDGKNGK